MNKTDMLKAAQAAEELGLDPDTVMVTYTLEEFSEAHSDEVDTFDEDKDEIENIKEALRELDEAIELLNQDIELTQRLIDQSHNWAEKYEQTQELRALERQLGKYQAKKNELLAQLEDAKTRFHDKYVR